MTQKTVTHTEAPAGVRVGVGLGFWGRITYFLFPQLGDRKLWHNCVATLIL